MTDGAKNQLPVFNPGVFEVASLAQAMRIVVTPEPGTTTEERWEKETRYLVEDIGQCLSLRPEACVLDFGCGPGRVAKGLIDRFGCSVVGVDFSQSMRLLAPEYVLSERFNVWSPDVLDKMVAKGFRVDAAICLWVIQHVRDAMAVIQQMARALPPGGMLYSLNVTTRCVPTNIGWVNDGFDIRSGLRRVFAEEDFRPLPDHATAPAVAAVSMIQILRKP